MSMREKREKTMQEDLRNFFEHGPYESATKSRWPYLRQVAVPMALAHKHWKSTKGPDRYTGALEILDQIPASDWRRSAKQWVRKREARFFQAQDDGVTHAEID